MYDEFDNGEPKIGCSNWRVVDWVLYAFGALCMLSLTLVLIKAGVLTWSKEDVFFDGIVIGSWVSYATFLFVSPRSLIPLILVFVLAGLPFFDALWLLAQGALSY